MSIKSAIDIEKCCLVAPLIANKANKYECPICKTKVKLNKGECKICYFSHYQKDGCNYYSKEKIKEVTEVIPIISDKEEGEKMNIENESIFHKEGKILIKGLIENGYKISFERACQTRTIKCSKSLIIEAQPYCENSKVELEYHMKHNDRSIYCDLVHIVDGEVKMIYEICYKHRTAEENRPNNINWVDIDVKNIYDNVMNDGKTLIFKCSRNYECDKCKNYIIRQKEIEEEQRKLRIIELQKKREEEEQRIANNKYLQKKKEEERKAKLEREKEEEQRIANNKYLHDELDKVIQNIKKLEEERKANLKREEEKRKLKIQEQEMKNREEIKKNCGYSFKLWYLKTLSLRGSAKALNKYKLKRFLGIYDYLNCCGDLNCSEDKKILCNRCVSYKNTYKDFFTNN